MITRTNADQDEIIKKKTFQFQFFAESKIKYSRSDWCNFCSILTKLQKDVAEVIVEKTNRKPKLTKLTKNFMNARANFLQNLFRIKLIIKETYGEGPL